MPGMCVIALRYNYSMGLQRSTTQEIWTEYLLPIHVLCGATLVVQSRQSNVGPIVFIAYKILIFTCALLY